MLEIGLAIFGIADTLWLFLGFRDRTDGGV